MAKINTENAVPFSESCVKTLSKDLRSMDFDQFLFAALKFVFERAQFKDPDLFDGFVRSFCYEFTRREEIHRAIDKVMDQYE